MSYLLSPQVGRLYVRVNADGVPEAFTWQGRMHTVTEIVDTWKLRDNWWNQPVERDYYKVTTSLGWLVVVYINFQTQTWHLERVQD